MRFTASCLGMATRVSEATHSAISIDIFIASFSLIDDRSIDEKYEVFSAGSNPTQVNSFAIKVMAEIGVDISKQYSKSIEEFRNKEIDLVVSVCRSSAKLMCSLCSSPIVMGRPEIINTTIPRAKRYLHHGFNDPSEVDGNDEEKTMAFRRIRDGTKQWIIDNFADPKTISSDNDV